jgi:hypothetical protein
MTCLDKSACRPPGRQEPKSTDVAELRILSKGVCKLKERSQQIAIENKPMFIASCTQTRSKEEIGPGGGSRTHTGSDPRQILSLLRLPVPPLRAVDNKKLSTSRLLGIVRLSPFCPRLAECPQLLRVPAQCGAPRRRGRPVRRPYYLDHDGTIHYSLGQSAAAHFWGAP